MNEALSRSTPDKMSVLVTGANTGIGLETTRLLLSRRARVFAGYRSQQAREVLDRLAEAAPDGGVLQAVELDVTDPSTIASAVGAMRARLDGSGLTGLVNNAGVVVAGPLEALTPDEFEHQFAVNVSGTLRVVRACLPLLRDGPRRPRTIVNIGSIAGRLVWPFIGAYAASKHGLAAMSSAMRMELAPWMIRVVLLEPGSVATPLWDKAARTAQTLRESMPRELQESYGNAGEAATRLMGRAGRRGIPPIRIAREVVRAMDSRHPPLRRAVGSDARWIAIGMAVLPGRLRERLVRRIVTGR